MPHIARCPICGRPCALNMADRRYYYACWEYTMTPEDDGWCIYRGPGRATAEAALRAHNEAVDR